MDNIRLNFINRSNDINNSSIVIFQRNVAQEFGEIAVAWKVFKNCGVMENHPFEYSLDFGVTVADTYGNFSPMFPAAAGNTYDFVESGFGSVLQLSARKAANPSEIEVRNLLRIGAIGVSCYRNMSLLAIRTKVAPGEKAYFEFEPRIFIGLASEIEVGDILNSDIISTINTEINLLGITSADIVLTGGGAGPNSAPFNFVLENVV
jgi:hypothetical protein